MQVIATAPRISVVQRLAVARSVAVALLLMAAATGIAWLFVGTPIVGAIIPQGRPTDTQLIIGVVVWAALLVVPAGLLLLGVARLVEAIEVLGALRPRRLSRTVQDALESLGPDTLAATDLRLPDGRRIRELVLGSFGIVVVGGVPARSVSRSVGSRWEMRDRRGRWVAVEAPVDRAARDAERVRAWLAADDRDYVVKVHPVVVTDDTRVSRSAGCAVVSPSDLAAWLAVLPPQRGLTATRRERIERLVRDVAASGARG